MAGCPCKRGWRWTDARDGRTYGPFSDCQLPDGSGPTAWCVVDRDCWNDVCSDHTGLWAPCANIGATTVLPDLDIATQCGAASPAPEAAGGGGRGNGEAIVAGVLGGVLGTLLLITIFVGLWLWRRRRRRTAGQLHSGLAVDSNGSVAQWGGDAGGKCRPLDLEQGLTSALSQPQPPQKGLAADPDRSVTGSVDATDRGRSYGGARCIPELADAFSVDRESAQLPALPTDSWQTPCSDIVICKNSDGGDVVLGTGAYGKVYRGLRCGCLPVAVKVLSAGLLGEDDSAARTEFLREVALLRSLGTEPHIVQFQGACITDDKMMLVTELCGGGNLSTAIRRGTVNWHKRGASIAVSVARGLHSLHSRQVVHMDLKSANVLLTKEGAAKIADVGLARFLRNGSYVSNLAQAVGTFAWVAPELLLNQRCTEKADMFSFGVLLWEIATGERPVRGQMRRPTPEECPAAVAEMMGECWVTDPAARPSAAQCACRLAALQPVPPRRRGSCPLPLPSGHTVRSDSDGNNGVWGSTAGSGIIGATDGDLQASGGMCSAFANAACAADDVLVDRLGGNGGPACPAEQEQRQGDVAELSRQDTAWEAEVNGTAQQNLEART